MGKLRETDMPNVRRIFDKPPKIREAIHAKVKEAVASKFPIESDKITVVLKNISIKKNPLTPTKQKQLLLSKGNASDYVICDLEIVKKDTKKVIATLPKHRIMNIPHFSERYSFLVDGNDYNIVNQLRTKSGVYTRKRGNDELESSFNLKKGANFKLTMNPQSGVFKLNILHATLPLVGVLQVLKATPEMIQTSLGKELYDNNTPVSEAQKQRTINVLYDKLVKYKSALGDTASVNEKIQSIQQYFSDTEISSETTKITLGTAYTSVSAKTILDAAKKMLKVYNTEEDTDDRDSLAFQKVYAPEDIVGEVVKKATADIAKIKTKLNRFGVEYSRLSMDEKTEALKKILSPVYFTKSLRNFITTSSVSRMPDQINPLEMTDNALVVTRLGEGAIQSERAVPSVTREVNLSYMGTIDPIASPESSKIGIDNRFTVSALKGMDDNELYKELINIKTGKKETLRLIDTFEKKVGFPDKIGASKKATDKIMASFRGEMVTVARKDLDYQIESPHELSTATVNNVPMVNGNSSVRILMGSKHQTQAMPLKYRDARLVEATAPGVIKKGGIASVVGGFLLSQSEVDGTVHKVDADYVTVKDKEGKLYKHEYFTNSPLARKTVLQNKVIVSVGDKVKKGQSLVDSNFTKDDKLALGVNLNVAYMPFKGLGHEDGLIASESGAKKLTSIHAEKVHVVVEKGFMKGKKEFIAAYPTEFTTEQLKNIDDEGVIKKGSKIKQGDPLILLLKDDSESLQNQMLGRLHKSLIRKYANYSEVYDHDVEGKVDTVVKSGKHITVLVMKERPAVIADKLSGSYGNKGVISKIIPDKEMVKDEEGNTIDLIMTPAGVAARMNPAQLAETALGKVAKKTGKTYAIENFSKKDYMAFAAEELKKNKMKDKETLTDPVTGKKIKNIFTGIQHIHKLYKTGDSNYAARGIFGASDQDGTPVGSGTTAPKAIGSMEVNSLLAHNARNFLQESTALRSSRNTDFWNTFQQGGMAHMPTGKPTYDKFVATLKQSGIKVDRKEDDLVLGPLTDKDVKELSSGEIKNPKMIEAKNLRPETGGLYDERITGGIDGEKWSHINLKEPVMSPVFEDPIASLLNKTKKDTGKLFKEKGGIYLKKELNKINIVAEIEKGLTKVQDKKLKGAPLDKEVKRIKYLKALKAQNIQAGDAYMLSKIPVTPPKLRGVTVGKSGDLAVADSNEFYKNLILINDSMKEMAKMPGMEEEKKENRVALQDSVRELTGMAAPQSAALRNRNVKGALRFIAGDVPKRGFFQRKVVYSKMNVSGSATITPDVSIGLDEIGLPIDTAWTMYAPFIVRGLTQQGYGALQAREEVENRSALAKQILDTELEKRPVITNRAPTLWKHSQLAAKPVLRSGISLGVNTLWEKGTNADFDGDQQMIHLPISDEAIEEANKMLPSKVLFSDKEKDALLMSPLGEPIQGLYNATENINNASGKTHKFKSEADAWAAYYKGTLKLTDKVEIG